MHPEKANILITGATGFLGSRILERLAAQKSEGLIFAAGRTLKSFAMVDSPGVRYLLGDLADPGYVKSLFADREIRFVINCAAKTAAWGRYEDFYHANVLSQKYLIEESMKAGVLRFVHISTPSIYFDFRDRMGIRESDPLPTRMVNHYAATKLEADKLLETSQLSWIALRPRALVGRGDTVIMPRVIRAFDEGKLKIIGNGENLVDLSSVSNVVDAVMLSLTAGESATNRIYNISNGNPVRLWEILGSTLAQLDRKLSPKKIPYGLAMAVATLMELSRRLTRNYHEPALTRYGVGTIGLSFSMDISKAQRHLGYQPRQSVHEAIEEFLAWYKALKDEG